MYDCSSQRRFGDIDASHGSRRVGFKPYFVKETHSSQYSHDAAYVFRLDLL